MSDEVVHWSDGASQPSVKDHCYLDGLYERSWRASGLTEEEYNDREMAKLKMLTGGE